MAVKTKQLLALSYKKRIGNELPAIKRSPALFPRPLQATAGEKANHKSPNQARVFCYKMIWVRSFEEAKCAPRNSLSGVSMMVIAVSQHYQQSFFHISLGLIPRDVARNEVCVEIKVLNGGALFCYGTVLRTLPPQCSSIGEFSAQIFTSSHESAFLSGWKFTTQKETTLDNFFSKFTQCFPIWLGPCFIDRKNL